MSRRRSEPITIVLLSWCLCDTSCQILSKSFCIRASDARMKQWIWRACELGLRPPQSWMVIYSSYKSGLALKLRPGQKRSLYLIVVNVYEIEHISVSTSRNVKQIAFEYSAISLTKYEYFSSCCTDASRRGAACLCRKNSRYSRPSACGSCS